jgi:hypothetical protein
MGSDEKPPGPDYNNVYLRGDRDRSALSECDDPSCECHGKVIKEETEPPRSDYGGVYLRDRPNPDYDPDAEPPFTESFNSHDWAKAFVATVTAHPEYATDEMMMTEWFANALMRGYDERSRIIAQATGVETGQTKWDDRATDAIAPGSRPTGVFERRVLQRIIADPVGVLAGDLLEMLVSEQVGLLGEDLEALSRSCRKAAETCYGESRLADQNPETATSGLTPDQIDSVARVLAVMPGVPERLHAGNQEGGE